MADFNKFIDVFDYSNLADFILQNGTVKLYSPGEVFSRVNTVSNQPGYICQGAFRYRAFSDDGKAHSVGFVFEKTFVCDYSSFSLQKPSLVEIEAMTRSEVCCIDYKQMEENTRLNPEFSQQMKRITELLYFDIYERYIHLYTKSAQERYHELITRAFFIRQ